MVILTPSELRSWCCYDRTPEKNLKYIYLFIIIVYIHADTLDIIKSFIIGYIMEIN